MAILNSPWQLKTRS